MNRRLTRAGHLAGWAAETLIVLFWTTAAASAVVRGWRAGSARHRL